MKFTLAWLKDHLDTTATVAQLSDTLSAIGLEVESVEDPAAKLSAFTVARIVDAKKHPNADKLQVVQVEIAKGQPLMEVVCGAPNARAGMLAVFAPLGTYIPGSKITLEKKPVRGVVSNGMMCSAAELELASDADGIIDLPETFADKVGQRYVDASGLNDPVFEVKLTPNRPDCTGVRGIARDLAAAGLGTLKAHTTPSIAAKGAYPLNLELKFSDDAASACPVFASRAVKGVKNGASPAWLQDRLRAIGLRPINALVDVTNYISYDRGRPLHVFDADKLKGTLHARLGKTGESFKALDANTYAVDDTMCVIADDSGVLGLGGIMGGEASGCTDATTNVIIESAYFDPVRIATTGRKTGIKSDARYRFERGVDPAYVKAGLDLATAMITKICGGSASDMAIAGVEPVKTRTIAFNIDRVAQLSGIDIKADEITRILTTLGFKMSGSGKTIDIEIPSWRPDVHGAADLVEEVVRIAGLDRIPATPLPRLKGVTGAVLTDKQKRARRLRKLLSARGLTEAVTWSFIPKEQATHFGGGANELDLANPISVELSSMRPGLLPGLLTAVTRNRNRAANDLALFELGQAYRGPELKDQYVSACGVRTGTSRLAGSGRHWEKSGEIGTNLFDVKADVVAALAALGIDANKAQTTREAPAWYHPGRSAALKLGPKTILAYFGEIHPATLKALDVEGPVVAFEIFLDALPPEKKKSRAKSALPASDLLPVTRDFAFIVGRDIGAGDIVKAAANADKALVQSVNVFDVFEGGQLAADGKKSVAIEVTLQPATETLTDAAIDAIASKIIADVQKATGGEIRG